jgi:ribose-phosphate pyrophosphokinase
MMHGNVLLFSGTAHPELARAVAKELGVPLGDLKVTRFANGETCTVIDETVRGRDAFVIQPTSAPANDTLMELLIIIDAMRRSSAGRIHAVLPWFGYCRQDRQAKTREPITAKLVANMIAAAGADSVVTIDLHSGQTQGFFDIPVDNLYATPLFLEHIQAKQLSRLVIVSPDVGGSKKVQKYANALHAEIAVVYKRRPRPNVAEAHFLIGDVKDRDVVIVDDIIDTAGTIVEAVRVCRDHGAHRIFVCATHAVFSPPAVERLSALTVDEIVVTDTIPLAEEKRFPSLKILSVAPLIAEAVRRIHEERALSPLFDAP